MTRVWALFFCCALSVAFLLHSPTGWVSIPFPPYMETYDGWKLMTEIPADVFYYDVFQHIINIVWALIMLSAIFWPVERKFLWAYVVFLIIEIVDFCLFRLYYRGWFSQTVPWNVVKTSIMGVTTMIYQWREWRR